MVSNLQPAFYCRLLCLLLTHRYCGDGITDNTTNNPYPEECDVGHLGCGPFEKCVFGTLGCNEYCQIVVRE